MVVQVSGVIPGSWKRKKIPSNGTTILFLRLRFVVFWLSLRHEFTKTGILERFSLRFGLVSFGQTRQRDHRPG